jgi:phosphoribosylaminoimidazolecarboxamide formyltransferase/IMP cyclohydrolase
VRALLSVADRKGIAAFARDLRDLGVEMFATDGTREFLAGDGIDVRSVAELTDDQPTVGGQVKTFHHAVYAGILARRDVAAQMDDLQAQGIVPIDLVIVNVKPFAPTIGAKLVGLDEAIEMIDVAGAALLGAAARNSAGVAAASDPSHYGRILDELREHLEPEDLRPADLSPAEPVSA